MEILYILLATLVGSGLLYMIYTRLIAMLEKAIVESENTYDDMLLQFKPKLDELVKKGEIELKELLEKKIKEIEDSKK